MIVNGTHPDDWKWKKSLFWINIERNIFIFIYFTFSSFLSPAFVTIPYSMFNLRIIIKSSETKRKSSPQLKTKLSQLQQSTKSSCRKVKSRCRQGWCKADASKQSLKVLICSWRFKCGLKSHLSNLTFPNLQHIKSCCSMKPIITHFWLADS